MRYGPSVGRVLGIDPGRRRVGLAASDDAEGTVALPLGVVERTGDDRAAALAVRQTAERLLEGAPIDAVVIGLPLRLNGTEGTAARRVRRLGEALGEALAVPVNYWDERMTTVAAEGALRAMGVRGTKQRQVVDATAATLLLQSFLEASQGARP